MGKKEFDLIPVERDNRIDSIRGFFLIIMVIDHFGGWVTKYTWQPFGYISQAEGFVYVSGYVFGLVYSRYIIDSNLLAKKVIYRGYTIYKYHFLLVFGIPLLTYFIPYYIDYWKEMLSYFFTASTLQYALSSLLMINQPTYMDVLPMYTLFIFCCWPLLKFLGKGKENIVLLISLSIWILGQFFDPFYYISRSCFPGSYSGTFNILGWQILFFLGVYFGFKRKSGKKIELLKNKFIIILGILFFLIFLISRHNLIPLNTYISPFTDRKNLSCLRLLNFLVMIYTASLIMKFTPLKAKIPWLHFIGKHSLYVFSFHILIIYLFISPFITGKGIYDKYGNTVYLLCLLLFLISLSIPALIHKSYLKRKKQKTNFSQ